MALVCLRGKMVKKRLPMEAKIKLLITSLRINFSLKVLPWLSGKKGRRYQAGALVLLVSTFLMGGYYFVHKEAGYIQAADQEIKQENTNGLLDTWAISVNGEPILYLASQEEAAEVLAETKNNYIPKEKDVPKGAQINVEESEFLEDVQIVQTQSTAEQLKTKKEAVEAMLKGLDKIVQHTVKKGESLWTIARNNDMKVSELEEINPSLKEKYLQIGQTLNLKKIEPLVTVVSTLTMTMEEKIPCKVVYEKDSSLLKGQQKVKKPGSNGTREVTYRISKANNQETEKQTLQEKVLQEPETKVILKGAQVMVASRDSGDGTLGWPIRGKITSPYGVKRGRSIHTGLDIDGVTGQSVFAAEAGTVIRAAWYGNYGKCIDINHGNGMVTRYAHLSALNVRVGQSVARGDLVGKVGSTGKSTGSHLHFEVIKNGKFVSPRRYLD